MLEKIIMKALKSMTPEEKTEFRKSLDTDFAADNGENPVDKVDETKGADKDNAPKTDDGTPAAAPTADSKNADGEATPATEEGAPQVTETEDAGNGVRVEDLVTKDELAERLAALDAKLQAVLKENQDLKDKYENPDFGTAQKKGVGDNSEENRKNAYVSFEEYAKQYS